MCMGVDVCVCLCVHNCMHRVKVPVASEELTDCVKNYDGKNCHNLSTRTVPPLHKCWCTVGRKLTRLARSMGGSRQIHHLSVIPCRKGK